MLKFPRYSQKPPKVSRKFKNLNTLPDLYVKNIILKIQRSCDIIKAERYYEFNIV